MNTANPRRRNSNARNKLRAKHKAAGETCYICGQAIDYTLKPPHPYSYVLDETIPIKHGGNPYSYDNTHAAHWWCNRIKSTHSLTWAQHKTRELITQGKAPQHNATTNHNQPIKPSHWF